MSNESPSPNLSPEQDALLRDLQSTPWEQQTPEMKEMVERLGFLSLGFSEEEISEFFEIRTIAPQARTLRQQEIVLNVIVRYSPPEGEEFLGKMLSIERIREKYRLIVNRLMVFPPRMHEAHYREEIEQLTGELDSLMEEYPD